METRLFDHCPSAGCAYWIVGRRTSSHLLILTRVGLCLPSSVTAGGGSRGIQKNEVRDSKMKTKEGFVIRKLRGGMWWLL